MNVMKKCLVALCLLAVCALPVTAANVVIQDYEAGGAPFDLDPNFSGSTTGILPSSAIALVADGVGGSTQASELTLDDDPASAGGWITRFVANGAGHLVVGVPTTGYIGFRAKLDQAYAGLGLEVGFAVDDPGTADIGNPQTVVADGQWHLYQWNLADDSDWTTFDAYYGSSGLGNGTIDGATVELDSIAIRTAVDGDAVLRIDDIVYDPAGMIVPEPTTGLLLIAAMGMALVRRNRA